MRQKDLINKIESIWGDGELDVGSRFKPSNTVQEAVKNLYQGNNLQKTIASLLSIIITNKRDFFTLSRDKLQVVINQDNNIKDKFLLSSNSGVVYRQLIKVLADTKIVHFFKPNNKKKAIVVQVMDEYLLSQAVLTPEDKRYKKIQDIGFSVLEYSTIVSSILVYSVLGKIAPKVALEIAQETAYETAQDNLQKNQVVKENPFRKYLKSNS